MGVRKLNCVLALSKNENGFALGGILVAVGISGVLMAGIIATITNGWTSIAQQDARSSRTILMDDVRAELSSGARCRTGLAEVVKTYKLNSAGKFPLRLNFTNGIQVASAQKLNEYKLLVRSFEFTPTESTPLPDGRTSVYGDLEMAADSTLMNDIATAAKKLGKLTLVVTNSSQAIEDCHFGQDSLTADISQICTSFGGEWNGERCRLPTPTCFERNENVTWCGNSCGATTRQDGQETWNLINQVGALERNTGCKSGWRVTCRFRVSCPAPV